MRTMLYVPIVLAIILVGCSGQQAPTPALTSATLTSPALSAEETFRQDFYAAFEKSGQDGIYHYAMSFGFDDPGRHAFCDAVSELGWSGARSQLSHERFVEFKTAIEAAGYKEPKFPTGNQLYNIGYNWAHPKK